MEDSDRLWMDSYGFIYSADRKRMLKGASVVGAYWIPESVEEIEPGALVGCRIGTLHVPWTAHVHDYDQLVFSENAEENEELMPAVHFWTKSYANRDEETGHLRTLVSIVSMSMGWHIASTDTVCCSLQLSSRIVNIGCQMA